MNKVSVVLIDSGNVINGWWQYCHQNKFDEKIDYSKLINKLSEGTDLLRGYFYDGVPEYLPKSKLMFLEALQKQGIQLRTKVLKNRTQKCAKCGNIEQKTIQKGVDVSLATDILRHAWQQTCNICIVVSGDEDYKDAIECVKDKGIKVWVASFKSCLSFEMRKIADKMIFLDDIFNDIIKTY
jgi:uncharacterized LabA/DUF88 family protein